VLGRIDGQDGWLIKGPAVGGEQLDMALGRANLFARFIACGEISQYNAKEKKGPKVFQDHTRTILESGSPMPQNWMNIIAQRITYVEHRGVGICSNNRTGSKASLFWIS
jgi:hypothetical protein